MSTEPREQRDVSACKGLKIPLFLDPNPDEQSHKRWEYNPRAGSRIITPLNPALPQEAEEGDRESEGAARAA